MVGGVVMAEGGVSVAGGGLLSVSPAIIGWDEGASTPVIARQRFVQAALKPHITLPTLTSMRFSTKRTPWKWSGMATLLRMRT